EVFLENYLKDIVHWEVVCSGDSSMILSPAESLNMLRIVQEATQNMLKYSRAMNFRISIDASQEFTMIIEDDGDGISDLPKENSGNMGLKNIKTRMEEIGGYAHFINDQGFKITLCLKKVNKH
ncbi:MAG: hypothetical protein R2809_12945, partial [Flavobacteriales bacterium]